MADTCIGAGEAECCDCRKTLPCFTHWGPLVPEGKPVHVCSDCMITRERYFAKVGEAKPIGDKS